MVIII